MPPSPARKRLLRKRRQGTSLSNTAVHDRSGNPAVHISDSPQNSENTLRTLVIFDTRISAPAGTCTARVLGGARHGARRMVNGCGLPMGARGLARGHPGSNVHGPKQRRHPRQAALLLLAAAIPLRRTRHKDPRAARQRPRLGLARRPGSRPRGPLDPLRGVGPRKGMRHKGPRRGLRRFVGRRATRGHARREDVPWRQGSCPAHTEVPFSGG